jgi:SAM-dependent methyltransferase
LSIPLNRCRYWLDILVNLDLLEINGSTYSLSESASIAILSTLSQDAWRNIANESLDSYPYLTNLAKYIHEPGSALAARGIEHKDYAQQIKENPERARRFTKMLYELHQPLANDLADTLDMENVKRFMDLGGGSGIMSNALLNRYPDITSVIVDVENVCNAGKDILKGDPSTDRISYYPADFLKEGLPEAFDMILECDVCVYDEALFRKLQKCLNPGGRLVIVDQFATEKGKVPPGRPLSWGFIGSLTDPDFSFPTPSDVKDLLAQTGYQILAETELPDHWLIIDAIVPRR